MSEKSPLNTECWKAIILTVLGLSFIFGWNISVVNPAAGHFWELYNKSAYASFWDTYVVSIMSIGAIIGSIASKKFVGSYGPKGSMVYISIINILGCLLIWVAYGKHPKEDFLVDERYDASIKQAYEDRSDNARLLEKKFNLDPKADEPVPLNREFTYDEWLSGNITGMTNQEVVDPQNRGYYHAGFGNEGLPSGFQFLSAGRLLNGCFVGLASAIAPQYIMEISPPSKQGMIGVLNQLLITVGILMANIFGLPSLMANNSLFMFLFPGVVSGIFAIFVQLGMLTESPKHSYLIEKNRAKAVEDMAKLRSDYIYVEEEMAKLDEEYSASVAKSDALTVSQLFNKTGLRWQLITLIFMHVAQPMSGINAVFFYSNQIFTWAGALQKDLATYSIAISALNVFMTVVSAKVIEAAGRKKLLLGGYAFAVASMVILTFAIMGKNGSLSLLSLLGFIAGFAIGPGPIPWIYNSELFPTNARAGSGLIGCITNWGVNSIIAACFRPLQEILEAKVFFIFVIFSIFTCLYCAKIVPETRGKSANAVFNDFADKNGVDRIDEEENVPMRRESDA